MMMVQVDVLNLFHCACKEKTDYSINKILIQETQIKIEPCQKMRLIAQIQMDTLFVEYIFAMV